MDLVFEVLWFIVVEFVMDATMLIYVQNFQSNGMYQFKESFPFVSFRLFLFVDMDYCRLKGYC